MTLDERSASWKLLLPDGPRDRVLAVGLDAGGVVGLARTWRDVVWVPPSPDAVRDLEAADDDTAPYLANVRITNDLSGNGAQYDAVVVARPPRAMQRGASSLAGLCSDRGVLVSLGFAGSALTPSRLRRAGLRHVQCHAVLPADRPRVFFPTASRALRSRALAFHAPASRPRQWLLRASAALSDIGVRGHLHHGAVLVAGRASQSHNDVALAKWLSQALDLPLSGLVVYAGSESRRRKMTVLAVADGDRHDVVAKLADSTAGAAAVRQEAQALAALAASPVARRVPRPLLDGVWRDCPVHVQSCVQVGLTPQVTCLNDELLQFLVQLSHLGRTTLPARETLAWRRLAQHIEGADALPPAVALWIQHMMGAELAAQRISCHRTHGDFAPWNIKARNGEYFVVDWEESQPAGLALSDACHFVYRRASLVGPWPGAHKMLWALRSLCARLARCCELPAEGIDPSIHLWMLNEYLSRPSPHILQMLDAAQRQQPCRNA